MTNVNHGSYCRCAGCIDAENRVVATPAASTRTIDLLEAARKSGLRAQLHGLNATDARKLLSDFVAALGAPAATVGGHDASSLVPGQMHCARCKFQLTRTVLYMGNGAVGAGDSKTEPCPNGCGPLWPVTWEQAAREAWATNEALFERAKAAEDALAAVKPPRLVDTANTPEQDAVQVPLKFLQGFLTLAHNYSLKAEPPDFYSGIAGDAFSNAYRRCGQDLAKLRALLPVQEANAR